MSTLKASNIKLFALERSGRFFYTPANYIPKITLAIPLKNFGILTTTTFTVHTSLKYGLCLPFEKAKVPEYDKQNKLYNRYGRKGQEQPRKHAGAE